MHHNPTRAARLKTLLTTNRVSVLMEAHNGLSARLASEAGFEALWASGLAISAALGVRDSNEASWTQVLEVLEFMADTTDLPILLDGDTGYGNFNNVRRLVAKLEQRGIAGVCLEDKCFPKTNSFIDGERQVLAGVDEFCGKLRAATDIRHDPNFVVVARTEAFIAGWGLEEALLRATAYAESGADAVLVHSKRSDSREVLAFMQRWDRRVPIVIVPTKYPTERIDRFMEAGISNFIFANQSIRTVITALQRNLGLLRKTMDLMSVERDIAPVSEIFRLQNVQELKASEERYLPKTSHSLSALVLAASKGDFGDLVKDRPKAMLRLRGRPVLSWQTEALRRQGIRKIGVVRGYCKAAVDLPDIETFDNDAFAETNETASLYAARPFLVGDVLITYGDILFDEFILRNLISQTQGVTIAVDGGWKMRYRSGAVRDLVVTSDTSDAFGEQQCRLQAIGADIPEESASGEWIGLLHLQSEMTERVVALLDALAADEPEVLRRMTIPDMLGRLMASGTVVTVVHTFGHWHDLDTQRDFIAAETGIAN